MKNNYKKNITHSLKALILVIMASFGVFTANAQIFDGIVSPGGSKFPGEADVFTYSAAGFSAETTFYLYYTTSGTELEESKILATSTVQGPSTDLDFNWPIASGNINLIFAGFSGDIFEGSMSDIEANTLMVIGATAADKNNGYSISMYRTSSRYLITPSLDLDEDVNVRLNVMLNDDGALDDVNPLVVQYSTDGTTYTDLAIDALSVGSATPTVGDTDLYEFNGNGDFYYDLPDEAKTASTKFRIMQKDAGALQQNEKSWDVLGLSYTVGNVYTMDAPGVGSNTPVFLETPEFEILSVLDAESNTITIASTLYPGDEITLKAELQNVDLTLYNYSVVFSNIMEESHFLTSAEVNVDNVTKQIEISGTIPVEIDYSEWMVNIYAFDKADDEIKVGINENADFSVSGTVDDFMNEGGEEVGSGLLFAGSGERSITTQALSIASKENGYLSFELARANDLISPSGTDLIIEYTTNGTDFTALETVALNDLPVTGGSWTVEFLGEDWPAGVVSSSTQFRVRQEGNNGSNLDAWVLVSMNLESDSNIANANLVGSDEPVEITVSRPVITVDPLTITEVPYPMTDMAMTYTIEAGMFPDNTGARVMLVRTGDPDFDIILGEIEDVTAEEIAFKVPPMEEGDYNLYLTTENDEQYGWVSLPIYNIEIAIGDISYSNSVSVLGEDHAIPGSDITVNYVLTGTPGPDAELMLSVYDYNLVDDVPGKGGYVMLSATTDLNGSITATLPSDINYRDGSSVKLSIGTGIFSTSFSETVTNVSWYTSEPPEGYSLEGDGTYAGYPASLVADGTRSLTTEPFDLQYGGSFYFYYRMLKYDFGQEIRIEASADGIEWIEAHVFSTLSTIQNYSTGSINIPNEAWSETTQLRVIYNEDGEAGFEQNAIKPYYLNITRPEFMETSGTEADLPIARPALDVAEYDHTDFGLGETVTIEYNAQNFPVGTAFAAVLRQQNVRYVLGTSDVLGNSSFDVEMPILPINPDNGSVNHRLKLIPYTPEVAGADFNPGLEINFDLEEDIAEFEGGDFNGDYNQYEFSLTGARSLLTAPVDLAGASEASLSFNYWTSPIDVFSNKNTVPRLEVSTDGGANFDLLVIYPVDDDEEKIYDDGLLYINGGTTVDIPVEYLTESVQFRWSQPLNMGADENNWNIGSVTIQTESGNEYDFFQWTSTENNAMQGQAVTVSAPDLMNYTWMQNDQDDAVFNGESFDYSWNVRLDEEENEVEALAFPAGTNFTFTIDELDPETGENIIIGTSTTLGVMSASVPSFLPNRTYEVMLTATVAVGDEEFEIYVEEIVGSLDVFLQVIKTTYLGDDAVKLYAGNTASFGYEIVNDATAADDTFYASLYYNLVIENAFDGEDYLLAAQQGLGVDFNVTIPAFIQAQEKNFVVKGSEGAPLGEVGTFIGLDRVENLLEDRNDNFLNFNTHMEYDAEAYFTTTSGYRELVTKDLDVSDAKTIEFELDFDQEKEDLIEGESFAFEYSIDGGVTYVMLSEFPRLIDEGDVITDERVVFILPAGALTSSTRFRWKQDDAKGTINLRNIKLGYLAEFPFETIATSRVINKQVIQVTGFSTATACSDATVSINYSLKGSFSSEAMVEISYRAPGDGESDDLGSTGYIYPLVVGATGTLDFDLSADFFEDFGYENKDMRFTLEVEDASFQDVDGVKTAIYSTQQAYSAATVEYISPIVLDTEFSISSQQECSPQDIKVTVTDPQPYFTYQFLNAATGETLGSALTYDPTKDVDFVNIGMISDPIELQMQITSGSADGSLTCNTVVSNFSDDLVVNPQYVLYRSRDLSLIAPDAIGSSGTYVVSSGETESICSGSTNIGLKVGRIPSNTNNVSYASSGVEWFRDNLATPVAIGETLTTFAQSGDYFARVTDGACTYTTEVITINVLKAPARPEITVVSGSLLFCEGEGEVVLSAPEGFAYYKWSNGEGTRTITVEDNDSYTVQVANVPIDGNGCASQSSKAVVVEMVDSPEFFVRSSDDYSGNSADNIVNEGTVLKSCMSQTIYFYENTSNINTGIVAIFKDGAEYATTTNSTFTITESGVYSAERRSEDLTVSCVRSIGNFTVTIDEKPTGVPALTSTGNLEFCEGEGMVVLTAPTGFANYQWYKNGSAIGVNTPGFSATLNTLEVTEAGNYSVSVGNASGCYGPVSNVISVTVRSLPSLPSNFSQVETSCGEGAVTFSFYGSSSYRYQLINALTGQPSGNSVSGASPGYITSDAISEATPFYFEVSYADGSGCVNFDEFSTRTGYVNNVSLELDGNTLQAVISSNSYDDIRWYRNGVLLKNRTGSSISITDAAEYSVEVDFSGAGVCTQSSNSINLGTSASAGRNNGRITASTYPNPSQNELNVDIEGENYGIYRVDVMSLAGQVLISHKLDKQMDEFTQTISVRHLERGIYNLHISKDGISKNFRIVKN